MSDLSFQESRVDMSPVPPGTESHSLAWTEWLAMIAVIMVMLFSTHSFQFLFVTELAGGLAERPSARSNPIYAVFFLAQMGLFVVLLFLHMLRNGIPVPLLWATGVCAYVASSLFWSISPKTTLTPAILFSYLIIAGYVASASISPRSFTRLYFFLGLFLLVSSFILLFTNPENAGSTRWGGGWFGEREFNGVMSSKNFAGIVFASVVLLSINGDLIGIPRLLRFLGFLLGIAAVVLSNSATAVIIVILLGGAGMFARSATGGASVLRWTIGVLALLIPALPFISAGNVLSLLGRDATFTGRAHLWDTAFVEFQNHPLLGHGYYAFFDPNPYSPVWRLWDKSLYWLADNFHNSSVDVLISLGLVGVALMLGMAIKASGVVQNRTIDLGTRLCLGLMLGCYVIGSMMEFAFFHHNYIATFMLSYMFFASMWDYGDLDEADTGYAE